MTPDEPGLVAVFVTVAVRVRGAEPGPGVRRVPPEEAARLVNAKHAVYGEAPPRGYDDGGCPPAIVALTRKGGA
jgi:hypothetical protein